MISKIQRFPIISHWISEMVQHRGIATTWWLLGKHSYLTNYVMSDDVQFTKACNWYTESNKQFLYRYEPNYSRGLHNSNVDSLSRSLVWIFADQPERFKHSFTLCKLNTVPVKHNVIFTKSIKMFLVYNYTLCFMGTAYYFSCLPAAITKIVKHSSNNNQLTTLIGF